jgi:DNA modification methylase
MSDDGLTYIGDWIDDLAEEHGMEPVSLEERQAWAERGSDAATLRTIAERLDGSTWTPSVDLARSLMRAAALALEAANGRPDAMLNVRDGLILIEHLFRKRGAELVESNLLVAQRIRTEWDLGEAVRISPRQGRGRPAKKTSDDLTFLPTLADLGFANREGAKVFRRVSQVERERLESWMAERIETEELSTAAVIETLWKPAARAQRTAERESLVVLPAGVLLGVADAWHVPLLDGCVDLTVTSPPYGLDIDYDNPDIEAVAWLGFLGGALGDVRRVTKPGGRLALNVPLDTTKPWPRPSYAQAVAAALSVGWTYRFTIVWDEGNTTKGNRALGSVNSSARPHHVAPAEMIAVFSNGEWAPSFDGPDDILPSDWQAWGREIWRIPGESRRWESHPAPFPEELVRRLIHYLSPVGATVLDPFMGSGTTPVVAYRLGRRALGFDISSAYVKSAARRLVDEQATQERARAGTP